MGKYSAKGCPGFVNVLVVDCALLQSSRVSLVSRVNVKLVEDFFGVGDDEHSEALRLPSVVARLEQKAVLAGLLLVARVSHAAAGSCSLLIIDEFESVGIASLEHPNAVGQVGVVCLRRGLRDEVRGDQEPFVFLSGRHRHLNHVLKRAAVMLYHSKREVTLDSPVCSVGETALALYKKVARVTESAKLQPRRCSGNHATS